MEKITLKDSKKLTKRLAQYGALTVAIAGVADASGQIIYTDIADVTIDGVTTQYNLDLDNDASEDYLLRVNPSSGTPFAFIFPATGSAYNSNGIVGASIGGYNYPSNLTFGTTISSANGTIPSMARGDLNFNGCAYSNSQFCDGMDGYLGFNFMITTNIHYGWARVQVSADATTMVIKDYAYNSTPGDPIDVGQQTLSVPNNQLSDLKIVALNKSIAISNMTNDINYNLYSISGQSVLKGSISGSTYVIEANSVSTGIYILELTDLNTKAVIRKKVIL